VAVVVYELMFLVHKFPYIRLQFPIYFCITK